MERVVYRRKIMKRPSQIVLGFNEDYRLKDVSKILAHYGINEVNEQTAHKAFLLAKEEISQSDRINTHFEQSTFARNIAGAQLIFTLVAFIAMFLGDCIRSPVSLSRCFSVLYVYTTGADRVAYMLNMSFRSWRRKYEKVTRHTI